MHSHSGACPKGRIKGSLLILQVKKKPKVFGGAAAANAPAPPKAAPPKLPSVPRKVRRLTQRRCATRLRARASIALPPIWQGSETLGLCNAAITPAADAYCHRCAPQAVRGATFLTPSHDASRLRPAPSADDAAHRGSSRNEPPPGAEFADVDVDAENRRRAAKAARAVASKNAKAAATPLGSSNEGKSTGAAQPASSKSPWWEQIQRTDDAYEPKGFNNLVAPTGFTVPARNPWAQPPASLSPTNGAMTSSGSGSPHGSTEHHQSGPLNDAELAYLYAGPVQVPDGRDPDALFAQLLEMGYSEEDSHEVAFRCSTIEAAVEAINNKTDPAFLAELDAQYQAALAFQERAALARQGALPPVQSAASLAADAAAAAALHVADNSFRGGAQPADDGWKTVKTRAQKAAGSAASAASGGKANAPLTLPKDAGAVLLGLYRSKKLRLADVPLPVLNALAQAPDGVAYECMRSLEESLRRGNTIRQPGSWLMNAVRILTEQYRMCSLSDSEDDDSWSDSGSRSGSSPAGSSFGGSFSSSRPRQAAPPAAQQHGWQAPRTAQHVTFAAMAAAQPQPVSHAPVPAPAHWPSLQAPTTATLDPYSYSQQHASVSAAHGAYAQPAVQAQPTPQPAYAAYSAYSAPQPAVGADDDLAFILNQLDVR